MDALYRTAPLSMGDPDALYAAMLQLPVFEGVTGPVQLGDDGDRLARFTLVNLQMLTGTDIGADMCERRRRRLASSIILPETRAAFIEVGEYDSLTGRLTVSCAHVHAYTPRPRPYLAHPALPWAGVERQYCLLARHVDSANYVDLRRARLQRTRVWGCGSCDDRLGFWVCSLADHHSSLRFAPGVSSSSTKNA